MYYVVFWLENPNLIEYVFRAAGIVALDSPITGHEH